MIDTTEKIVLLILKKININVNEISDINQLLIPREIFLCEQKYNDIKNNIPELKKVFKSSYLNSLQSTAEKKQSWPLLNLVRQILKSINYKMVPKRVCDGYDKEGKKKFKRFFNIEKLESNEKTDNITTNNEEDIKVVELHV
jgi:hypothetical protein